MFAADLPWGAAGSRYFILLATTATGDIVERGYPFDGHDLKMLDIQPGEVLGGRISVNFLFNDLPAVLKKQDVNLFWSYRLPVPDLKDPHRLQFLGPVGGWIPLQSKKPQLSPPPVGK